MLITVLIVLLVVILIGGWPSWGYHAYGYGPSSVVGVVLLVLLVLLLLGRI